MTFLERDMREPLADLIRTLLERQDELERRVSDLERLLELVSRRRPQNGYASHELYALDHVQGPIE